MLFRSAFAGPYDVVCYNFSLHYIFDTEELLDLSVKALRVSVKPAGLLLGITPEKARAEAMVDENNQFVDELGNKFQIENDKLIFEVTDGPFYALGAREEPLLDGSILIQNLKNLGFDKLVWEPMLPRPNGMVSDLYTKFVFRNSRDVAVDYNGCYNVHNSGKIGRAHV